METLPNFISVIALVPSYSRISKFSIVCMMFTYKMGGREGMSVLVARIRVTDRVRKEITKIAELAADIEANGLLNPITVMQLYTIVMHSSSVNLGRKLLLVRCASAANLVL